VLAQAADLELAATGLDDAVGREGRLGQVIELVGDLGDELREGDRTVLLEGVEVLADEGLEPSAQWSSMAILMPKASTRVVLPLYWLSPMVCSMKSKYRLCAGSSTQLAGSSAGQR
jgi:hypothetical protein